MQQQRIRNEIIDPATGARIVVLAYREYSDFETRAVAARYFRAHPSERLPANSTLTIWSLGEPGVIESHGVK